MEEDSSRGSSLSSRVPLLLVGGLLFARLISLLAFNLEGLRGYGDFFTFFRVSSLPGWPFLNYWVEFPPVFPWINALLNRLAGAHEHVYDYLLVLLLLCADAGSLYLFSRLSRRIFSEEESLLRSVAYMLLLLALAYAWWYFDPLAVFFLLLGLWLTLDQRMLPGGLALGMGVATKLFPGLGLLATWRRFDWRKTAWMALLTILPLLVFYGLLYAISPDFTRASIRSQGSKGSWETVWALLDGNWQTGNFGALEERLDPAAVTRPPENRAVIPPAVSLVVFGAIGLWGLLRAHPRNDRQSLALVGYGLTLLLLWSPGWSPQWILYLLPLLLLALPAQRAILFSMVFVLVNLLEWPVLLSRGLFSLLWLPVVLRTFLLLVMALAFYTEMVEQPARHGKTALNVSEK